MYLPIQAVITDFDGTLIDSHHHGRKLLNEVLLREGIKKSPKQELYLDQNAGSIGPLEISHCFDLPKAEGERLHSLWHEIEIANEAPVIPNAFEALETLIERGFLVTLLSSRSEHALHRILALHGIKEHFVHIACGGVGGYKPEPGAFTCTMQKLELNGISHQACVMVGDTSADIDGAHAMRMRSVLVQTGPGITHLRKEPTEIVDSFESVPDLIARWNATH